MEFKHVTDWKVPSSGQMKDAIRVTQPNGQVIWQKKWPISYLNLDGNGTNNPSNPRTCVYEQVVTPLDPIPNNAFKRFTGWTPASDKCDIGHFDLTFTANWNNNGDDMLDSKNAIVDLILYHGYKLVMPFDGRVVWWAENANSTQRFGSCKLGESYEVEVSKIQATHYDSDLPRKYIDLEVNDEVHITANNDDNASKGIGKVTLIPYIGGRSSNAWKTIYDINCDTQIELSEERTFKINNRDAFTVTHSANTSYKFKTLKSWIDAGQPLCPIRILYSNPNGNQPRIVHWTMDEGSTTKTYWLRNLREIQYIDVQYADPDQNDRLNAN